MADAPRARRLAKRIAQIVASALEHEVKDPRLAKVTITDAKVTGDLRDATVYYTVLPEHLDAEPPIGRLFKLPAEIFHRNNGRIAGRMNIGGFESCLALREGRDLRGAGECQRADEACSAAKNVASAHCLLPRAGAGPARCRRLTGRPAWHSHQVI